MNAHRDSIEEVKRRAEDLSGRWLTRGDLERTLLALLGDAKAPACRIRISFTFPEPFTSFVVDASIDSPAEVSPNMSWDVAMKDSRPSQCHVECWKRIGSSELPPGFIEAINSLLYAFWKPDLRTGAAGIPDVKRASQVSEYASTALTSRSIGSTPALLFCDLDKFKSYNDRHGEAQGDIVIRTFGAVIEQCAATEGIVMHNGGDEFLLMLLSGGELAALQLAQRIRNAVAAWVKRDPDLGFTVSIGIAAAQHLNFSALTKHAETVVKTQLKGPGRETHQLEGSVRFTTESVSEQACVRNLPEIREMAKCLIKSATLEDAPFANVWLNAVSSTVQECRKLRRNWSEVSDAVNSFLDWVKAELPEQPLNAEAFGWGMRGKLGRRPVLSSLDIAFGIAHGLLRIVEDVPAAGAIVIRHDSSGRNAAVIAQEACVWRSKSDTELSEEFAIGCAPGIDSGVPENGARAVLVKIGHQAVDLPEKLFSTIMVVDDRPTMGGGLPDFWELTIARLVAHVVERPRILAVFVLGNRAHGARTVDKLEHAADWKEERDKLAERLPVSATEIAAASDRLVNHVYLPDDESQLVMRLGHILHDAPALRPDAAPAPATHRSLHLHETNTAALGREDGCRVATLADAYPAVLQILRASNAPTIRDQAGQTLRELLDFKVVLSRPTRDSVPTYFMGQQSELEAYYKRAFLNSNLLFDRALRKDGQLDVVLRHVREILKTPELEIATRRAVLVVPHECKEDGPCAPLGLTSIRIIPRFENERITLSFSFTWRTVEALIGFPYSMYGSVRYSECLLERVCEGVPEEVRVRVTMGELSYIAHSLHLFADEYGMKIVRRIVHEASD